MTKKSGRRLRRRLRKVMNWKEDDKWERARRRELRTKKANQRNNVTPERS